MTSKAVVSRSQTEEWLSEQTGVEVAERDGMRVISVSPQLRERVNLLTPVSQVQQMDTNFSPNPRLLSLDIEEDTYKESGKRALTAKALNKLADLAGIEHVDTVIDDMGGAGVRATVVGRMRGPDGHWRTKKAIKTVRFDRLEAKIRRETLAKNPQATEDYLAKRSDDEFEHIDSKVETKAWNRIVRSFLAVKSTYDQRDLAKPFLVIGYSFTPDYSNPQVTELLRLEYGSSMGQVYGGDSEEAVITRDLDPGGMPEAADEAELISEEDDDTEAIIEDGEIETVEGEVIVVDDHGEIIPKPEESFVFKNGPWKGKSVEEVVESPTGLRWLANTVKRLRDEEKRAQAIAWIEWRQGQRLTAEQLADLAEEIG